MKLISTQFSLLSRNYPSVQCSQCPQFKINKVLITNKNLKIGMFRRMMPCSLVQRLEVSEDLVTFVIRHFLSFIQRRCMHELPSKCQYTPIGTQIVPTRREAYAKPFS